MATATTSGPQQQVNMPAIDLRRFNGVVVAAEGVRSSADFVVVQRAAGANMSVDVGAGQCYIQDDHGAGGGFYHGVWTGTDNVAIAAADPTNPRVDRLVVRVRDQFLGDATNAIDLFIVQGAPTVGATLVNCSGAGAVPGSCLLLANILVPAAAGSILTANIDNTGASNNAPAVRPKLSLNGGSTNPASRVSSVALAYNNANQAITTATTTAVLLTTLSDNTDGYSIASNQVVVPRAGYYRFTALAQWAANATGYREIYVNRCNSSRVAIAQLAVQDTPSIGATIMYQALTGVCILAVNESLQLMCQQNSGGNLNFNAGGATFSQLTLEFIGV